MTSASFSPDGQMLATGGYDCQVRLWDTRTWQEDRVLPGHRRGHVAFSRDGILLVSGGTNKNVTVFETATWQIKRTLYGTSRTWCLFFTPDGKRLAIPKPDDEQDNPAHLIEFRDTTTWRIKQRLSLSVPHLFALAFHPDGEYAAIATGQGHIEIWNVDFTQKLIEFSAHRPFTWGLAFSPDGTLLATGGADNVARIWNTADWTLKHELAHEEFEEAEVAKGFRNAVLCTAFSPDGKLLVTGGLDGVLTVWQL